MEGGAFQTATDFRTVTASGTVKELKHRRNGKANIRLNSPGETAKRTVSNNPTEETSDLQLTTSGSMEILSIQLSISRRD